MKALKYIVDRPLVIIQLIGIIILFPCAWEIRCGRGEYFLQALATTMIVGTIVFALNILQERLDEMDAKVKELDLSEHLIED